MMSAPSLPSAQGPAPAGFAAFLATIGQVSADGSEAGGFDQLLAAAPVSGEIAPADGAAAIPFVQANAAQASPVKGAAPQVGTALTETAVVPETPVAKPETVEADAAAALAANLLIALNGGNTAPAPKPVSGKPVPAATETETADDTDDTAGADEAVTAAPVATWLAAVVAVPATTKPAKPAEAAAVPARDAAAAPAAARSREAAPTPMLAIAGTEPQTAKPAEAAPSMTIHFAQPAAQGTAILGETAQPALIAERVLDMDSDGAWIDQLARDIAATKSDSGDISFRLMPRHLGRLDVAMRMDDEGVSLKMDTHHEATATIVTAAQGKLVEELRQQGVRISSAEVTCTPGETGRQSQGQGRAAIHDPAHLIETATERGEPRPKTDSEERAGDRRGRFA